MRYARGLVAALACALAGGGPALADRSRLDDDTDVLDAGDCELEMKAERTTVRGAAAERGSAVQLGCGIGWRTELVAMFATNRSDGPRTQGSAVEGKTALRDRSGDRIGWTLAYGVATEREAGLSWRRSGQFIAIEATRTLGRLWLVEAKLGAARDRASHSDATRWGLAVERALTDALEAGVEIDGDDRQRPLVAAGLRYEILPDRALVSLSYGLRSAPIRERRLSLAITVEF